jgi:hypothetical protein
MDDGVHAFESCREDLPVSDVTTDEVSVEPPQMLASADRLVVEHTNVPFPIASQPFDKVPSDESATACNEHSQGCMASASGQMEHAAYQVRDQALERPNSPWASRGGAPYA